MKVYRYPGVCWGQRLTMNVLDWSQCEAVESVPDRMSGVWVFRDTRFPVATIFENLEDMSVDEVLEVYDVTREQIEAVLEFVAKSLRTTVPRRSNTSVHAYSV